MISDDRYKKIMSDFGMPNSTSLYLALKQVENEATQAALSQPHAPIYAMPKDMPCNTGVGLYCAPGPASEQERHWILRYEDADHTDVILNDEQAAREAFSAAEGRGWNCHLFEHALRDPAQRAPISDAQIDAIERASYKSWALSGGVFNTLFARALLAAQGDAPSDLIELLREIAACSRSDPNKNRSGQGNWATVNMRSELINKIDAAIAASTKREA